MPAQRSDVETAHVGGAQSRVLAGFCGPGATRIDSNRLGVLMTRSAYIAAGLASGEAMAHRLLRSIVAIGTLILFVIITNGS